MKRFISILAFIFFTFLAGYGQDYKTSLGLRLGLPFGVTIRHFINEDDALEGILASRWQGFIITGLYEKEKWMGKYPGLNWFWGGGAHIGFWGQGENPYLTSANGGSVIGIDGVVGIEYTFDDFPVNLGVDLLPSINLIGVTGWGGINGALSIRYVF